MKKAAVIALILGIIMIITSVVLPILSIIASAEEAVGIIGGADGPTAILITTEISRMLWALLITAGAALVAAIAVTFIVLKSRKK